MSTQNPTTHEHTHMWRKCLRDRSLTLISTSKQSPKFETTLLYNLTARMYEVRNQVQNDGAAELSERLNAAILKHRTVWIMVATTRQRWTYDA